MGKVVRLLPKTAHPQVHHHFLMKEYNLPGVYYLDNWPITEPMCIIADPEVAYQVTQKHSLPKSALLSEFVIPIAGRNNLLIMEVCQD
jgi:hypothetical protein